MHHAAEIVTADPTRDGKGTLYTVRCGDRHYHLRVVDLVDEHGKSCGSLPVITPAEPIHDHMRARHAGLIAIERIVNAAPEPPSRRLPKLPPPRPEPPVQEPDPEGDAKREELRVMMKKWIHDDKMAARRA